MAPAPSTLKMASVDEFTTAASTALACSAVLRWVTSKDSESMRSGSPAASEKKRPREAIQRTEPLRRRMRNSLSKLPEVRLWVAKSSTMNSEIVGMNALDDVLRRQGLALRARGEVEQVEEIGRMNEGVGRDQPVQDGETGRLLGELQPVLAVAQINLDLLQPQQRADQGDEFVRIDRIDKEGVDRAFIRAGGALDGLAGDLQDEGVGGRAA